MSLGLGWKLKDADEVAAGGVVAPDERLGWGKTVGLGAQHVVAMFGATFVFPLIMGLNAQLAIMMSGIATIIFLLIVQGKVPSYLGTSASFVGGVAAIRANGGDSKEVTGAILIAGIVLAIVGVIIHFAGSGFLHKALPPVVTGAVVMLIGFNLAPVVANIYWPQDQWVALLTMLFTIIVAVAFRGFIGRISVFLALIFGTLLSWILDKTAGPITSVLGGATEATEHLRWNTAGLGDAGDVEVDEPFDLRGNDTEPAPEVRRGAGEPHHADVLHPPGAVVLVEGRLQTIDHFLVVLGKGARRR